MHDLTNGQEVVAARGSTLREVIENLQQQFPDIRDRLCDEDRIKPGIAVSVDGELSQDGMRARVNETSELHFLPAISGGSHSRLRFRTRPT